jgi:hypothetical protein
LDDGFRESWEAIISVAQKEPACALLSAIKPLSLVKYQIKNNHVVHDGRNYA